MHISHGTDVLDQLRREWRQTGHSPGARAALDRLRGLRPDLVPSWVTDLFGLVLALEPGGGLERLSRAQVVTLLLEEAEDPLVRRCLLQTLVPGIVSVARKLRFGDGIADDPRTFLADALAEATALLCSWAGQHRSYAAPDLLGALRCRLRRRMLADKARRFELTEPPDLAARDDACDVGTLARVLAAGIDAGRSDDDLLYARCVLGVPTSDIARALGLETKVVRQRLSSAAMSYLSCPS